MESMNDEDEYDSPSPRKPYMGGDVESVTVPILPKSK